MINLAFLNLDMKTMNMELGYLKQNKDQSKKLQDDVSNTENRIDVNKNSIQNMNDLMKPIGKRLDEIMLIERDASKLDREMGK